MTIQYSIVRVIECHEIELNNHEISQQVDVHKITVAALLLSIIQDLAIVLLHTGMEVDTRKIFRCIC